MYILDVSTESDRDFEEFERIIKMEKSGRSALSTNFPIGSIIYVLKLHPLSRN
jgi:hypothetical protein